jgi:hypothetical protein
MEQPKPERRMLMATVGQVRELVTTELEERVDRLISEIEEDAPDFGEVARLADAVGEFADQTAAIYLDLEQSLIGGLQRDASAQTEGTQAPRNQKKGRRREQRQQRPDENGSTIEDVTKEELLEKARGVNVQGRSSMSKQELAEAVEAEESQTKEELLERAREAEVEGRSAMSKKELRKALNKAEA